MAGNLQAARRKNVVDNGKVAAKGSNASAIKKAFEAYEKGLGSLDALCRQMIENKEDETKGIHGREVLDFIKGNLKDGETLPTHPRTKTLRARLNIIGKQRGEGTPGFSIETKDGKTYGDIYEATPRVRAAKPWKKTLAATLSKLMAPDVGEAVSAATLFAELETIGSAEELQAWINSVTESTT